MAGSSAGTVIGVSQIVGDLEHGALVALLKIAGDFLLIGFDDRVERDAVGPEDCAENYDSSVLWRRLGDSHLLHAGPPTRGNKNDFSFRRRSAFEGNTEARTSPSSPQCHNGQMKV